MKSVSFVEYKIQPNPKTKLMEEILEEVACDGSSNWMTSVCMLEDGRCLGSDNSYNLLALGRNMNPADLSTMSEEEKRTLRLEGYIHVGDGINQMKRGKSGAYRN